VQRRAERLQHRQAPLHVLELVADPAQLGQQKVELLLL
jgi:hypothetical protein